MVSGVSDAFGADDGAFAPDGAGLGATAAGAAQRHSDGDLLGGGVEGREDPPGIGEADMDAVPATDAEGGPAMTVNVMTALMRPISLRVFMRGCPAYQT